MENMLNAIKDMPLKAAYYMAKRTVLNRAAKMFINTSDDSDLLTGAINDTTSNEFDDEPRDVTPTKEEQTTQELLDGFEKSQAELAKKEEPADDHSSSAEGEQEELFKDLSLIHI